MAENARIDNLRRRVQKDPASIAFAQLAEEHRRAGQFLESVEVCHAGLAIHPTYLSARVTLGRALIELGRLDEARAELQTVLKSAPENLAAIRGVAEICHKQGSLEEALRHYKLALLIARNDPELEQTVNDLSRQVAPQPRPAADNGLSLDDMRQELKALVAEPPAAPPAPIDRPAAVVTPASFVTPAPVNVPASFDAPAPVAVASPFDAPAPVSVPSPFDASAPAALPAVFDAPPAPASVPATFDGPGPVDVSASSDPLAPLVVPEPPAAAVASSAAVTFAPEMPLIASPERLAELPSEAPVDPALARAHETIAVLEQWLDAIHGSRAH